MTGHVGSNLPAFDAIVIGAGPTGLACGIVAALALKKQATNSA